MRILYHMPFKPMGHATPSGDLMIGTELHRFLTQGGHSLFPVGGPRTRWIYWHPQKWPDLLRHGARAMRLGQRAAADLWLTYHSYYKAPDLLGPFCSKRLGIPYVVFQGIFSTKVRRRLRTLPGYWLNRRALQAAELVFTNKKRDHLNLARLIPPHQLIYLPPGIPPRDFEVSREARHRLRTQWGVDDDLPVILSVAMFRPGVKFRSLTEVIKACGRLHHSGIRFRLVVVGDGERRGELEALARQVLPSPVIFPGKISRKDLYRYYSAADIFAFPGFREALGMVYLEAQSCGLPVVAWNDWGGGDAVVHGQTGLTSSSREPLSFTQNLAALLKDGDLRHRLGQAAAGHIRHHHNLAANYTELENHLTALVEKRHKLPTTN